MTASGGRLLVEQLIREGVEVVFGIPGVQLDWAVDALRQAEDRIRFVIPRHEQTASYMADGYARTTGREGVCMVVPGPGVLNALSGLATAYACSSRVLFIGGQIPSHTIGRGYGMLHEIPDQSAILKSLSKWHAVAHRTEDVAAIVHEAFLQLRSGRPLPVAIEFPPDVLQAVAKSDLFGAAEYAPTAVPAPGLESAANTLARARAPVIWAGGGVAAARAGAALAALAERLNAPVVMTEGAKGSLSADHPLALSTLGGRAVLPHADVVLVAASRFLDALANPISARPSCRYIYLNLDPAASSAPRAPGIGLLGDVGAGLEGLARALSARDVASQGMNLDAVRPWCAQQLRAVQPQADYLDAIRAAMADDDILVSELTQVGYYSTVAFPARTSGAYLTPGYQGTLGYGFPTALGAAIGNPGRRVVSITGDGGFGWGLAELATARRYNLDMTVVVFNDGQYGNVRRIQARTFGAVFATELTNPDFQLLAQSFGLRSVRVEGPGAFAQALGTARSIGGPWLIEAVVGEMDSPWSLIHSFVPSVIPPPPNPLGDPAAL